MCDSIRSRKNVLDNHFPGIHKMDCNLKMKNRNDNYDTKLSKANQVSTPIECPMCDRKLSEGHSR